MYLWKALLLVFLSLQTISFIIRGIILELIYHVEDHELALTHTNDLVYFITLVVTATVHMTVFLLLLFTTPLRQETGITLMTILEKFPNQIHQIT